MFVEVRRCSGGFRGAGSKGLNNPRSLLSHGTKFLCGVTHFTTVPIEVKSLHDATVERFISWRLAPCTQAVQVVPVFHKCRRCALPRAGHLANHFSYYVTSRSTGLHCQPQEVVLLVHKCLTNGNCHVLHSRSHRDFGVAGIKL